MRTDLFVKHLTIRLPRISEAKKNVRIFSGTAYQIKKLLTALCKKSFFLLFPPKVFGVIFSAPVLSESIFCSRNPPLAACHYFIYTEDIQYFQEYRMNIC